MAADDRVVVGIDVGGPRKGFHAVALKSGTWWGKFHSSRADRVTTWCRRIGARVVVDLIDKEDWSAMSADVKGDAYEGLLEKNAHIKTLLKPHGRAAVVVPDNVLFAGGARLEGLAGRGAT